MTERGNSKFWIFIFEVIIIICMFSNTCLSESAKPYKEFGGGWLTGKPAFSPDDKYLVLQTSKGIHFYKLPGIESSDNPNNFLLDHQEYRSGRGFCFTNDKERLISATELEKNIKVWDWKKQKLLKTIPVKLLDGIADMVISNDDSKLLIGTMNKILLIDLKNNYSVEPISTEQFKSFPQPAFCFNLRFINDNTFEFDYVDKQYHYKIKEKEFTPIKDSQNLVEPPDGPMEMHSYTNKWICKINSLYCPLDIQLIDNPCYSYYNRHLTESSAFPRFYCGFNQIIEHVISPNGQYYSMIQGIEVNGKNVSHCIIWELEKYEVVSELFIPSDIVDWYYFNYYFKDKKLFVYSSAVVDIENNDFENFRKYLRNTNLSLPANLYVDETNSIDFRIIKIPPENGPYRFDIHSLREHRIVSSSTDNRYLLLRNISSFNNNFIFDKIENKIVRTIHSNKVISNVSSKNTFIVYERYIDDLNIPILEFPSCKLIACLTGIKNKIGTIHTSPNRDYYITTHVRHCKDSGFDFGTDELNIIDVANNCFLKNVLPPYGYEHFSFSENGRFLILCSTNHKIIVFDFKKLKIVETFDIEENLRFKSATIPKGSNDLYVVFVQGFIRKYNLKINSEQ